MRISRSRLHRATAILMLFMFTLATGCATMRKNPKEEAALNRIASNPGITVVIDSSVIHGKTSGNDMIAADENIAIAKALEEHAINKLRAKGYIVHTPGINSIGMGVYEGKTYDLVKAANDKPELLRTVSRDSAPFMITPESAASTSLMRKLAVKAPLSASEKGVTSGELLLVIKANGRYISGGQMAANVPLAVVQVALVSLMLFGGGNSGGDMPLVLITDKLSFEMSVVDAATGEVLISKAFAQDNGTNPDVNNFGYYVNSAISWLPNATTSAAGK